MINVTSARTIVCSAASSHELCRFLCANGFERRAEGIFSLSGSLVAQAAAKFKAQSDFLPFCNTKAYFPFSLDVFS